MNGSPGLRLEDVLTEQDDDSVSVRWHVGVPIMTNPFILVDFARFILITVLIIFVMVLIPQWFYTRSIGTREVAALLKLCALGAALFTACFAAIGIFFLRNRYYALYVLNDRHIYYENIKGSDESGFFSLALRPFPVKGRLNAVRVQRREISWQKVDSFVDFPAMRTILLKRGMWEILKLYLPDRAVHERARAFLEARLEKRNP